MKLFNRTPDVRLLSKVPEVTFYFWIIKILCTTVGETAADFLNVNLNFGLIVTSIFMWVLLVFALISQFKTKKYTPSIYWISVMFISVFGTIVTDIMTDSIGIPLEYSTIAFTLLLAGTFFAWYRSEKTLSIHSIYTKKREMFYWLTILFTFALGTASGDLMAEWLALGYSLTGVIIAGLIVVFAIALKAGMNQILAFWMIYILTRPLGASIGDFLSQSQAHGWLGLGTTMTSAIFIAGIIAAVTYLTLTKKDVIDKIETSDAEKAQLLKDENKWGLLQTVIVLTLLLIVSWVGYSYRQAVISAPANTTWQTVSQGFTSTELQGFTTITQDTLTLLQNWDQVGATARIWDLEYEWDQVAGILKSKNKAQWVLLDDQIDAVLRELRSTKPNTATEQTALQKLLTLLQQ